MYWHQSRAALCAAIFIVFSCKNEYKIYDDTGENAQLQTRNDQQESDMVIPGLILGEHEEYEASGGDVMEAQIAFKSCLEVLQKIPNAPDGIYPLYSLLDDGQLIEFSGQCDMKVDNGGWTLISNYLHKGNTNPLLTVLADSLPILGGNELGIDEQKTKYWGHGKPSFVKQFEFSELRFYCQTKSHKRMIHFKTREPNCLDYIRTGIGHCDDVQKNFVALTGHTAFIPGAQLKSREDQLDFALSSGTFRAGGKHRWELAGGGNNDDWECDDDVDNSGQDTLHRVWIR